MKQKKSLKTLTLKRNTVANLGRAEMQGLQGGGVTSIDFGCYPTDTMPYRTMVGSGCDTTGGLNNNTETEDDPTSGSGTLTDYKPVL